MSIQIGDNAPDFTLVSDQNEPVSLKDYRGKKVVLYFYPKNNTPKCTRQACNFRDMNDLFAIKDAKVIGISRDSVKSHQQFKQKYNLPFQLLADDNGDACDAYGVINKKSFFGNIFFGIQRSTFLVDENGIIRAIWRKVNVNEHTQQVLDELNKI